MGTLNQQALDFLIAWRAHGAPDPERAHDMASVLAEAQQVADFLGQDNGTTSTINSADVAEILVRLEGLAQQMTEMSTALADFNAAVQADVQAKQNLKDQVTNLQSSVASLQSLNASDEAALADAKAQLAAAANQVEAAAQQLNPLPPAPTPVDTTPPPADGSGGTPAPGPTDTTPPPTDTTPAPVDTTPPADTTTPPPAP